VGSLVLLGGCSLAGGDGPAADETAPPTGTGQAADPAQLRSTATGRASAVAGSADSTASASTAKDAGSAGETADLFDGYLYGSSNDVISQAQEAFLDRCMAAEGFTEDRDDYGGGSRWENESQIEAWEASRLDDWWGVSTPEYAAEYGYHEVPADLFMETWGPTGGVPPDGFYEALSGPDGDGGCYGQWYEAIDEGTGMASQDMWSIQREAEGRVTDARKTDPGVLKAAEAWNLCMAAQGYNYADPHAAMRDFDNCVDSPDGQPTCLVTNKGPAEEELRVAVADATCKQEVGFWEAVSDAKDAEKAGVLKEMLPQLEKLKAATEKQAANAAKIVAELQD
jgi:hypothetical protein